MSGGQTAHYAALARMLVDLDAHPDAVVFHYVRAALAASGGNISMTARRLGIHRRTLQRMLERPRPKSRVEP